MKKGKIAILTALTMAVALLLIVIMVGLLIVYTANLETTIDYEGKTYATADKPVEFNVASYNIRGGYTTTANLNGILDALKEHDIDIVGHQEVDTDESMRTRNVQCIATLTKDSYKSHFFAPTNSLFLGRHYGIMTMSTHDIKESGALYLPMPNRNFMLRGEPRVCIRTIVNIDGTDIAFYNTHLSFENGVIMPEGGEMREAQLRAILSTMDADPCQYRVLVGDMNILSFDELEMFTAKGNYKMMNNESKTLDSYRGDDVTFKALDNIIYSSNMTLTASGMVDSTLSDHNMLYATLRID